METGHSLYSPHVEKVRVELETDRLLLREFHTSDAESFFSLNADPVVMKYTGDVAFKSVEDAVKFVKNYNQYRDHGYGRWTVLIKSSMEFAGWCGLKYHEGEPVDLGYRFCQKHWNKGFATESARACLDYGFNTLDINKIMARIDPANAASIKVAQKLGMAYWKTAPCEHVDKARYYILERLEFQQKNQATL